MLVAASRCVAELQNIQNGLHTYAAEALYALSHLHIHLAELQEVPTQMRIMFANMYDVTSDLVDFSVCPPLPGQGFGLLGQLFGVSAAAGATGFGCSGNFSACPPLPGQGFWLLGQLSGMSALLRRLVQ